MENKQNIKMFYKASIDESKFSTAQNIMRSRMGLNRTYDFNIWLGGKFWNQHGDR